MALLYKWRWRFLNNPGALWVNVIQEIHGKNFNGIEEVKGSTPWLCIKKVVHKLHSENIVPSTVVIRKVGSGTQTRFWKDVWLGTEEFVSKFHRLFLLSSNKDCLISDMRDGMGWKWHWRRPLRGGREEAQLRDLISCLLQARLMDGTDSWCWLLNGDSEFSVKSLRKHIDNSYLPDSGYPTRWNKYLPKKVNICAWRVLLDRLPTRWNISNLGIDIDSIVCPICMSHPETMVHLFGVCHVAVKTWRLISSWLEVDFLTAMRPKTMMEVLQASQLSSKCKSVIEVICFTTWWVLWNFRNKTIFHPQDIRSGDIYDSIVLFSFLWYSNRNSKVTIVWDEWLKNPLLMM